MLYVSTGLRSIADIVIGLLAIAVILEMVSMYVHDMYVVLTILTRRRDSVMKLTQRKKEK